MKRNNLKIVEEPGRLFNKKLLYVGFRPIGCVMDRTLTINLFYNSDIRWVNFHGIKFHDAHIRDVHRSSPEDKIIGDE